MIVERAGRIFTWGALGIAVLTALPGPSAAPPLPTTLEDPVAGSPVPLLDGSRVVHLVFFGIWCPPCLEELDELAELEARFGDRGYRLVLVAVATRHERSKLARFVEQNRPPGRLLFDAAGRAEAALEVSEVPTHLLLDGDGREILRAGALDDRLEETVASRLGRRRSGEKRP